METNASIICACLPIVYSLLVLRRGKDTTTNYGSRTTGIKPSGGYKKSADSTMKSFKSVGCKQDWEMSTISMEQNSHYVRIDSEAQASDQKELLERPPMALPHMKQEFQISTS